MFFASESLSFEASWAVSEKLAHHLGCDPTQFRPHDPLNARTIDGTTEGLSAPDEIDEFCVEFDLWLDSLDPVLHATYGCGAGSGNVQTIADLIRWVEPFMMKKAKSAGLCDDAIR
ncbi:MAG: hypothetical protein JWN86_2093 [Planctomycetota bacterium]|nr:hypothetical protein [Planctomycetota bacterium]